MKTSIRIYRFLINKKMLVDLLRRIYVLKIFIFGHFSYTLIYNCIILLDLIHILV